MGALYKLLAMTFWHLRRTARATSGDSFADSKALIVIAGVQVCLLIAVLSVMSVVFQRRIIPAPGLAAIVFSFGVAGVLVLANQRLLLFRDRWRRFESEFERRPRHVKAVQAVLVWAVVIAAILLMLVTASLASRIPR